MTTFYLLFVNFMLAVIIFHDQNEIKNRPTTRNKFLYYDKCPAMKKSNKMKTDSSRRKFIKQSLIASSVFIVPRHVLGGVGFTAPSAGSCCGMEIV